jgi:hypothetical protein
MDLNEEESSIDQYEIEISPWPDNLERLLKIGVYEMCVKLLDNYLTNNLDNKRQLVEYILVPLCYNYNKRLMTFTKTFKTLELLKENPISLLRFLNQRKLWKLLKSFEGKYNLKHFLAYTEKIVEKRVAVIYESSPS